MYPLMSHWLLTRFADVLRSIEAELDDDSDLPAGDASDDLLAMLDNL